MKRKIILTTGVILLSVLFTLAALLIEKKIWFVSPNKKVFQIHGLDISHHQGKINWDEVDAKYQFIFAKATEGDTFVDKRFQENVSGIKRTKRILGAYHFFHFNYDGEAQAHNYINTVGQNINLPPAIDFEFSGNPIHYNEETVIKELEKCINVLENYYGRDVIIYTTPSAYKKIIKDNFDNPLWYRSIIFPVNKKMKNLAFWQYHNSAIIDGIDTIVDLNVFKGTLSNLQSMTMGNL